MNLNRLLKGKKVQVTDTGEAYTTYENWSGLKGYEHRWVYNRCIPAYEGSFTIEVVQGHDYESEGPLCLISNSNGDVYIIGLNGIELSDEKH